MNSPIAVLRVRRIVTASIAKTQQNRKWQPEKASVADVGEARIGERNDLAAGDQLRDTAAGDHQDKRSDDRLHVESPDEQTVPGARQQARRRATRQ